jgi:hypothetical protein
MDETVSETALSSTTIKLPENTTLYEFSGNSIESSDKNYISTGSISISGTAIETYSANTPENTYLYTISGQSKATSIIYTEFFGSLFALSNCIESITYDYNESSIFEGNLQDFGFVYDPFIGTPTEYGSVSESPDPQVIDYSQIINEIVPIDYPFGQLTISGSASYRPNYRIYFFGNALERVGYSLVGIGTLSLSGTSLESYSIDNIGDTQFFTISGTAVEAYSAQTPEDTQLFTVSGTALEAYSAQTPEDTQLFTISGKELVHPDVDYTPHYGIEENIGIGTTGVQINGEKIESRTYAYDEYAIVEFISLDYGLISNSLDSESEDYGDISLTPISITDNFGFIVNQLTGIPISSSIYPFGSVYILGSGAESFNITPYNASGSITISGFSSDREIQVYGQDYVTQGTLSLSGSLIEKDVDSYVGIGTLFLSGTALEAYSAQTPEDTQLFTVSGTALEAYSAQTPEDTQLFTISGSYSNLRFVANPPEDTQLFIVSGSLVEKDVDSYVGVGALSFSGNALEAYSAQTPENTQLFVINGSLVEKDVDSYVGVGTLFLSGTAVETYSPNPPANTQLFTVSGTALEAYSAQTPEDTQLFQISGQASYNLNLEYVTTDTPQPITIFGQPLVHPFVDYTPHYGIEKNIGIGTTGIQFQRGVGFAPDSEGNPRDARTYSNRYPINDKVPGTGIGTITFDQINNLAKYSPLTPYSGSGLFNIITGFSPQIQYPYAPLGIGKSWSYTRSTYISSGIIAISGIASTKEINVYGYYGDDNDPGTSGIITISQQSSPIIEKKVNNYLSSGAIYVTSVEASYTETESYSGSGSISLSSTADEVFEAKTPSETVLFNISGNSDESYSAQTPETETLYQINGSLDERTTNSELGSGKLEIGGSSRTFFTPSTTVRGLFRFINRHVDNDYDTCDSEEFTCDNQDSANISFVKNAVESEILFKLTGNSSTSQNDLYQYVGLGFNVLSGTLDSIKITNSESGSGTIFVSSSVEDKELDTFIGSGTLFTLSGDSHSYSAQTPENTVLITLSGSATVVLESDYPVVGVGLFNFYDRATTRKVSTFTQQGVGTVTVSGELLYPDIIFVPAPAGGGVISFIGSSNESITNSYKNTFGTLFAFSSGFESFIESGYVGFGTVYIQDSVATSVNNPFQIPRIYVTII